MKDTFRLNIDDELFGEIKHNFNSAVSSILEGMREKDVCEGEISLKVKISLLPQDVIDADGVEETITTPEIEHNVVTKMTVKSKTEGKIKGYIDDDYLSLREDGDGGFIALRTPRDASQMRL